MLLSLSESDKTFANFVNSQFSTVETNINAIDFVSECKIAQEKSLP